MIRLSRVIAGVAMQSSPSLLLPGSLNSGPAWITFTVRTVSRPRP